MKKTVLALFSCLLITSVFAQVNVNEGPALNNAVEDKMNRMIEGDEGFFYGYRIRTKGKGTTYSIEKFDKNTLKMVFSKDVAIPDDKTKVQDIRYAAGNVYVIYRTYDKAKQIMTLYYKTVSSDGVVSKTAGEFLARETDHYEYIDFDITSNLDRTKIAVKCTNKPDKKTPYVTDFVLFDGETQKVEWSKVVPKYLKRSNPWFQWSFSSTETTGFLGFYLDNNDDIYYAYNEKLKKDDKKDARYNATVEILKSDSQQPIVTKLDLNPEYVIYDLTFNVNSNKELMIAGFFKDVVERKGFDWVDVGAFTYKINTSTGAIEEKSQMTFDEELLTALESNKKKARGMNYKVDYLIPSGDDFYLVGEQYTVNISNKSSSTFGDINNIVALASGANPFYVGKIFSYEYMDIIVAKINSNGEFEWITNSPLRNATVLNDNPHVFKQYIATASSSGLYLFYNEHPKNVERLQKPDYKPKDLKTQKYIHGSNMVYSKITPDGKMVHKVAYENEDYCFAPIQERDIKFLPPEDAEIFVQATGDDIIIYVEDRGKSKFATVSLE